MGLTIHYTLHSDTRTAKEARRLVEEMRKRALDLPFAKVGELIELKGGSCNYEYYVGGNTNAALRWLAIQAGQLVERGNNYYRVKPKHIIAFTAYSGEECEPANFGLALYPATIFVPDPKTGLNCRLPTELKRWCWSSFCKTEYASNPAAGGVQNFLRCHLLVIRMLDHAKEIGILASVCDEGGFWEKRDIQALAKEVGEWNQAMAALVGQLKDMFGGSFDAPITKFPDFEHLEAKGRKPGEA
ncbi:MAG: hypothetical protein ACLP9L_15475 [Thermoguttaceae bacterium]